MTKIKPGIYYAVCNKQNEYYYNHTITNHPPYIKWVQFGDANSACLFTSEQDAQITKRRLAMALSQFNIESDFHITEQRLFSHELDENHPDYDSNRCFDGTLMNEPGLESVERIFR